jgi:hypothetical protein
MPCSGAAAKAAPPGRGEQTLLSFRGVHEVHEPGIQKRHVMHLDSGSPP